MHFKTEKKKLASIALLLTASTLLAVTANNFYRFAIVKTGLNENRPTIIIDAGHGGFDPGAVYDGIEEKNINLNISLKLRDLFAISGYTVIMSRESDISTESSGKTLAEKKRSDMQNRLDLMKDTPNCIFLSVHQNAYTGKSRGSQVFYSEKAAGSVSLAEQIQTEIVNTLQPDSTRSHKPAGDNYFLLRKATTPAVLIECGFLSDKAEAALLQNEEYTLKLCCCIYNGVCSYIDKTNYL